MEEKKLEWRKMAMEQYPEIKDLMSRLSFKSRAESFAELYSVLTPPPFPVEQEEKKKDEKTKSEEVAGGGGAAGSSGSTRSEDRASMVSGSVEKDKKDKKS